MKLHHLFIMPFIVGCCMISTTAAAIVPEMPNAAVEDSLIQSEFIDDKVHITVDHQGILDSIAALSVLEGRDVAAGITNIFALYDSILGLASATPTLSPAVTSTAASAVNASSGTLNGSFADLGTVSAAGFLWGTSSTLASASDQAATGTSSPFSATLSGLTASTTYYFSAYATDATDTYRGDTLSFTTTAFVPVPCTGPGCPGDNFDPCSGYPGPGCPGADDDDPCGCTIPAGNSDPNTCYLMGGDWTCNY